MHEKTEQEARDKVWELIKDIRICQLTTHGENGALHARPMSAQQKNYDGKLWFFTSNASPKVAEIERNPQVGLCYSDPSKQNYISLAGRAHIVRDRAKIKELWSEYLRTWFPKGAEDPEIALIHFHAESAEYWDSPSSAVVYAYGYVKARLTGERPQGGENEKVTFNAA